MVHGCDSIQFLQLISILINSNAKLLKCKNGYILLNKKQSVGKWTSMIDRNETKGGKEAGHIERYIHEGNLFIILKLQFVHQILWRNES